jgi:hypothetical protein
MRGAVPPPPYLFMAWFTDCSLSLSEFHALRNGASPESRYVDMVVRFNAQVSWGLSELNVFRICS